MLWTGRSDNSHRVGPAPVPARERSARRAVSGAVRVHNAPVTTAEVQRLAERARARRRRRRAGRGVRRAPSGTSASGARAGSSGGCGSRWRSPRSRAIPRRCSTARARSSRRRSATTRPSRSGRAGHGRLPRYIWHDRYADLREKLDALGRALGGDVPRARRREPARRPRGGRALGRRLLRQEHDGDHAPARLVGRARHARHDGRARADAAARPRLRLVHALHRRLPDRRARRAGRARRDALPLVLDAGARADAGAVPRARSARRSTAATSARTSARGTAASSGGARSSSPTRPRTSISSRWLEADGRELVDELDRLYVPRNDPRWLRRNALVALGNVGDDEPRTRAALRALRRRRRRAARRARALGARAAGGAVRRERRATDALRRELDELRARVARRAEFVALVAHDVRTPLAAIIGSARTLQQRGASSRPSSATRSSALIAARPTGSRPRRRGVRHRADRLRHVHATSFAEVDLGELVDEAVAAAIASGGERSSSQDVAARAAARATATAAGCGRCSRT